MNELKVDSKYISRITNTQSKSILAIIHKYRKDFEICGTPLYEKTKKAYSSKGGRPNKVFIFNSLQAILLLTYLSNTKETREIKKKYFTYLMKGEP